MLFNPKTTFNNVMGQNLQHCIYTQCQIKSIFYKNASAIITYLKP
ncbi:hypothetical protein PTRA_a1990 [Pseudoalteromonas translucida KMM 520]|uniref:Uncharacterized protein n=1 Tax=Pseudoalteromonas translucida KMM 520 TaxID=1315283 RepID=A0A0U2MPW4_9GAMM|nr:hypothetical protein PTRA_a1990 [Pseudoalteromonas translucida KMM 520]